MTASQTQDLYQAAITAFSLISYADGQVHMSELSRLLKTFKEEGVFKDVTPEQLQTDIYDIVKQLGDDPAQVNAPAFMAPIAKIKDDERARALILKIARLTVIADGEVMRSEQRTLSHIHRTLGLRNNKRETELCV